MLWVISHMIRVGFFFFFFSSRRRHTRYWRDRSSDVCSSDLGDVLVLTKPLGLGILTTALKRELVSEEEIGAAVEVASRLNKGARDALRKVGVSAATDVTGYGLLGHLSEMLEASGVGAVVRRSEVPVWERAVPLAAEGCYPGGLKSKDRKSVVVGKECRSRWSPSH